MFNSSTESIIILAIVCTILILLLITFISVIVYRYQQKQNAYFKNMEQLKIIHENALLLSHIEIQEQTFQNISREIHDNIGQKLSLAKLHLNTLYNSAPDIIILKIDESISLIGESIIDLSDISRSMSSEIILNNGLIKALEYESAQLQKSGLFNINLEVSGNMIFLDAKKELLLFRIVQEAIHNIIKHADASIISIKLHYNNSLLSLEIIDNGKGFTLENKSEQGIGILNMKKRADTLNGKCVITSQHGSGASIKIEIPIYEQNKSL